MDAFAYAPVMAGFWQQHQLWDGTYSLDDLLDVHEMLTVRHENEIRAMEAAEQQRRGM